MATTLLQAEFSGVKSDLRKRMEIEDNLTMNLDGFIDTSFDHMVLKFGVIYKLLL